MIKLGIMQGRLSPAINNKIQAFPVGYWEDEFPICYDLGLKCIEWIYEYQDFSINPLFRDQEIKKIKKLSNKYDVKVNSVVADYFMEKKLFNLDINELNDTIEMLEYLVIQCNKSEIPIIELPFVDSSEIKTDKDIKEIIKNLENPLKLAEKNNIKISFETSLNPKKFKDFIDSFKPFNVYINYDMGNSASLGYNSEEEIKIYGNKIINVHIKDRILNGSTVPLGEGDTNFNEVFKSLSKCNYNGDFILQAARQDLKDNYRKDRIVAIKEYIEFIKPYINYN